MVFIRILMMGLVVLAFAGCATTQPKVNHEQLQSRITDLEKKIEEKDAEIVDLQYEVKDLHSKVETSGSGVSSIDQEVSVKAVSSSKSSNSEIIRVNVPVESIQGALKAAGVYTGKIDGKVGRGTKAAIMEFQRSQGLKADGVLGKKTWDALKSYLN